MIVWSFGFKDGTVGVVAQLYGMIREITKTIFEITIGFIASIIIVLSKPLINSIDHFFSTSNETQNLINTYLSLRIFSIPAELVLYVIIGFYLGMQKTNISSLLIVILSALNIILSSFFVLTLNLDVFGVALGTLISTNLTMIIFITYSYFYILKKKPEWIIMISKFKKLFSLNFDIFLRTLFLTFSFLWVTYLGSKLGEDFLAVNTILMQFLIFAAFSRRICIFY